MIFYEGVRLVSGLALGRGAGLLDRLLLGCSDLPGKPSSSFIFFPVFISCFPFLFCFLF
jgi:hypothetical protein